MSALTGRAAGRAAAIGVALLGACVAHAQDEGRFDPGKASFSVEYGEETTSYRVSAVFVLPGEDVVYTAHGPGENDLFAMESDAGSLRKLSPARWAWRAPEETGLSRLRITRDGTEDGITIHAFVMVPMDRVADGRLEGYRIGDYPSVPLRGLRIYEPPLGFIRVTRENEDTLLSPHFRLEQFLCKQAGDYPKYVVLRERLLWKLELLLEAVNANGVEADTLHVMSGYRTPFYNRAIGNVRYSRHVWGGAADVFIDVRPRDGQMDDLNGDGKLDVRDAGVLKSWLEGLSRRPFYARFLGGLASYERNAAHGPFVHVDVRGTRARWGK